MSRVSRCTEPPKRPVLPMTSLVLAALLAAEILTLRGVLTLPGGPIMWVLLGCGGAACGLAAALRPPGCRLAAVIVAGALAAAVASSVALRGLERFSEELSSSPVSTWSFEVLGDPRLGTYGYRCRARATREGSPAGFVWLASEMEPQLGETITCVGRFSANADDAWGRTNRAQGIAGTVKVVRVLDAEPAAGAWGLLLSLRSRTMEAFAPHDSGSGALLAASICGYGAGMDERGLADLFSSCGVSHLVAVSGGHIVIVAGILSVLLEGLGLGPGPRSALLLALSGAFVVFCGAPISAVRSWLMTLVATGAWLAGRRDHALSAVCLVAIIICLVDPFSSGQLGFLLSVASVIALCVFSGYASYVLTALLRAPVLRGRLAKANGLMGRGARAIIDTLGASLVAQAATLPITVPTFGELSLVAPVANVVLAPPFSVLIGCGMVAGPLACLPGVAGEASLLPMAVARAASDVALAALVPLSRLPLACVQTSGALVPGTCVALLVLVYAVWPRVRRAALGWGMALAACGMAALLLRWRFLAPARIVVLDVGQGDAILVQDGAAALLVDAGPDASVTQALAREHVLHLDAVVLTHLHEDHVGGVDDLVGSVGCGQVLVGEGVAESESEELCSAIADLTGSEAGELSHGDELVVGGFSLRVISPTEPTDGGENEDSLELVVSYADGGRELTALLTGDAERDRTGEALARGEVGDVDLLKVGHHGSAVSLSAEEARVLDPEVSVASAGEGNRYGHPTSECVDILEGAGSLFLCTKDVGDVEVRPGRSGPVVRYDGGHEG